MWTLMPAAEHGPPLVDSGLDLGFRISLNPKP